jgi:hypothetical protein
MLRTACRDDREPKEQRAHCPFDVLESGRCGDANIHLPNKLGAVPCTRLKQREK